MENKRIKIKEVIIVEGRDDVTALKRVIDAHIVPLNGFSGLTEKSIKKLVEMSRKNELILFTDPDYAGKKIRSVLRQHIPNLKHIFISRKNAERKGNIGVENASDEAILEAFSSIVKENSDWRNTKDYIFTIEDLILNNLSSGSAASERRMKLGDILKIGYYNGKQLLNALNYFNITKEEFEAAVKKL